MERILSLSSPVLTFKSVREWRYVKDILRVAKKKKNNQRPHNGSEIERQAQNGRDRVTERERERERERQTDRQTDRQKREL